MRRPALIFDFGNVVAHFDHALAVDALCRPDGRDGAEVLRRARAAGFNELLRSYESGAMPAEAFAERACGLLGLAVPFHAFAAAWSDIFRPNPTIAPLIAELDEAGYTLVLGSNTNDLHATHFRRQFADLLGRFDRLVFSFEVGHSKPSPAFYLACTGAAGAPPRDCLFIDDLPENVDGAIDIGLRGLVYRGTEALRRDLAALGVDVHAG